MNCKRLSEHDPHGDCPGIAGFSPPEREARADALLKKDWGEEGVWESLDEAPPLVPAKKTWGDVNDTPDPNADLIGLRVESEERGVTIVVTGTPWYGGQYVDADLVDKDGKVVGKSGMSVAIARAAKAAQS